MPMHRWRPKRRLIDFWVDQTMDECHFGNCHGNRDPCLRNRLSPNHIPGLGSGRWEIGFRFDHDIFQREATPGRGNSLAEK